MAELREGCRGLRGFASEHLPRDPAAEQDLASHQEELGEEVPGDVRRDRREEGLLLKDGQIIKRIRA